MSKIYSLLFLFFVCTSNSISGQELKRLAHFGFRPIPLDSTLRAKYNLSLDQDGILIPNVQPGGTFSKLQVKNEDILLSMNSKTISNMADLFTLRNSLRAGDAIQVLVIRNQKELELKGIVEGRSQETSEFSEVIYDDFDYKGGRIRSIVNKPNSSGKHPVIFFIPGYNCASVDNWPDFHPYRKLIDGFVEKGYAVFRMEKPGVGDNLNTGDCRQLGFDNELDSYMHGFDQLKKYEFIDTNNIYLWGHSMGGLYAPLVAAEKKPKGIAFYGMVHDSWTEYLLRMVRYQNPRIGTSDYVQTDKDVRTLYALLYKHYHEKFPSKELAKEESFAEILKRDFWFDGDSQILLRHEKFWQELYDYSMTEALRKYEGYVLSMNGEADIEVINDYSQKEVVHIVNHYHQGKGEFAYFPKTDHSMIEVGTLEEGAKLRYLPEYRTLMNEKFNYKIVEKTHDWIQNKL